LEKTGNRLFFFFGDEHRTLCFGKCLAETFRILDKYPALLFSGPLGAGKTTMIRGIVRAMPGGHEAEVSSPSFNILNIYPTRPETAHFDLYRTSGTGLDPESEDVLLDEGMFIVVEWSEFLPEYLWPEDFILIELSLQGKARAARMTIKDDALKQAILEGAGAEFSVQG
jgi:tRNA threonylcarbamoyladenosine biosynthesis protein TsaE